MKAVRSLKESLLMCIPCYSFDDNPRVVKTASTILGLLLGLFLLVPWSWAQEAGITDASIHIGSTLPLEGDFRIYGEAIKKGMEAALADQSAQGRQIGLWAVNDFYNPPRTVEAAQQLIDRGIFLMLGSFGSPTTHAVLPLLAEHQIPALGFTTGAGFTEPGDILNFRASYAQEVATAIELGLELGIKPTEVCVYVQNDAYGMSGVLGLKSVLVKHPGTEEIIAKLEQILSLTGDNPNRNYIGPVGVYQRDTVSARDGYLSLKKWEETSGYRCQFVATTAVYDSAVTFMAYARYKNETWMFSSPSPAGGDKLTEMLKAHGITGRVIVTQIVPALDSELPVVAEARAALGPEMDEYALEGYLVGRLFLAITRAVEGPLTRESFLRAARRQPYNLGGIEVDYTAGQQGSNFVLLTHLPLF
jgi:branched-chain amino acid transport system substrate-binding protein